jgi:Dolichyl-phosphate-mannose-protein mannosyltransferase
MRYVIALLCLVAFGRVAYQAFAVDGFEHPDEIEHYDTVYRYSQGLSIARPEPITQHTGQYFHRGIGHAADMWPINQEIVEPPLYYWIAGIWARLGFLRVPVWNRLLAGVFAACSVVVCYLIGSRMFGDYRALLAAGLVACWPSGDLCGVTDDTLTPVVCGLMLLAVLGYRDNPGRVGAFAMGVAASAMMLTKTMALPLVVVAVFASGVWKRREAWLFVVGSAPCTLWLLRNWFVLGELTGVRAKFACFGFHQLPLSRWAWNRLTASNLWTWYHELCDSYLWGEYPLSKWDDWDGLVGMLTFTVVLIVPLFYLRRRMVLLCYVSLLGAVLFMSVLSLGFDFSSNGGMPSGWMRSPIMSNGRLVSGTLIPFCLLAVLPCKPGLAT